MNNLNEVDIMNYVTILVLVEYSLQYENDELSYNLVIVTILVLVEYSLQLQDNKEPTPSWLGHNPCFSRILFAISSGI